MKLYVVEGVLDDLVILGLLVQRQWQNFKETKSIAMVVLDIVNRKYGLKSIN